MIQDNSTNANNIKGGVSVQETPSLEQTTVKDERVEVLRVKTREGNECVFYKGTIFNDEFINRIKSGLPVFTENEYKFMSSNDEKVNATAKYYEGGNGVRKSPF